MFKATSPLSLRIAILVVLGVPLMVGAAERIVSMNDEPRVAQRVETGFDVQGLEGAAQEGLRDALRRQAGLATP